MTPGIARSRAVLANLRLQRVIVAPLPNGTAAIGYPHSALVRQASASGAVRWLFIMLANRHDAAAQLPEYRRYSWDRAPDLPAGVLHVPLELLDRVELAENA